MRKFAYTVLISLFISIAATALHADVIRLGEKGLSGKVVTSANTPRRGMSKPEVLKKFGAPKARKSAVGQPPISSWEYPNYSVYFEYNHVVHAVTH